MFPSVKAAGERAAETEAARIAEERRLDEAVRYETGQLGEGAEAVPFGALGHPELAKLRETPDVFARMLREGPFRARVEALDAERAAIEARIEDARLRAEAATMPSPREVLDADHEVQRRVYFERCGVEDESGLRPEERKAFLELIRAPYLRERAQMELAEAVDPNADGVQNG